MKDQKTKDRFVELRAQCWSFDRIAKEIGVTKHTLIDWSKELVEEIQNMKALELETIREKYILGMELELKTYRERLETIQVAISRKDLSELPLEKLIELEARFMGLLKASDVKLNTEAPISDLEWVKKIQITV